MGFFFDIFSSTMFGCFWLLWTVFDYFCCFVGLILGIILPYILFFLLYWVYLISFMNNVLIVL